MKNQTKRILSLFLTLVMLVSLFMPSAFADSTEEVLPANSLLSTSGKTPADESPYTSVSSIGDSIAAGYGPLMRNNTWSNYYYDTPPVGAYPYELTEDLGLSVEDDFYSMLCVDQRLLDVYYVMGGEVDPVVNPDNTEETLDYLEDARLYHSEAYMEVLEELHDSGEGAARIQSADLITVQIGNADLAVYPVKRTKNSDGTYDIEKAETMIQYGIESYEKYYPKMIELIKELNPDAKIVLISQYNPYEKFTFEGEEDQEYYDLISAGISLLNLQLQLWCGIYDCTYVDITDLSDYIDNTETVVPEGEFVTALISHENHPGAAGHRYIEDQILEALNLERPSVTPSTDDTTDYLCFTSDTHNGDDGASAARLSDWIDNVSDELGDITFDYMGICGDIGSAFVGSSAYGNKVQVVMDAVTNNVNVEAGIYTTGNHEYSPGTYATDSAYAPYSYYTRLGEAADTDTYQIYCFGAGQYNQQFNQEDIDALAEYLAQADTDEPVFVLSHFPIHSNASRSSANADKVIEVLNNYPNVIFLWGHNHTDSDPHYGIIYTGDLDGTEINFIYGSAGCMSDSEYSTGSKNTLAKGLVAEIDGDDDLVLTYYDKQYGVLASYNVNITDGTAEEIEVSAEDSGMDYNFDDQVYSAAETIEDGEYVIAVGRQVLNCVPDDGYVTLSNGYNYSYSGFTGGTVSLAYSKIIAGLTEDEVWTFTKVSDGYTIQNYEGKYLTASYTSYEGGSIQLEDTADGNAVWTWSDGNLKNVGTGKQLNYETASDITGTLQSGEANLFTIRSSANDTFVLYSAASSEAAETSDYQAASSFEDGSWYVITAENYALLSTDSTGYVTRNGSLYSYSGLNGRAVKINGDYITSAVDTDMLWQAIKVDGGYALRNKDGMYLNSAYSTTTSGYAGVGTLTVGDTAEAWVLSGTTLKGTGSAKYFNWQSSDDIDGTKLSGSVNFFTIRSSSKDAVKVYLSAIGDGQRADENEVVDTEFDLNQTVTVKYRLLTSSSLTDGASLVIAYESNYLGTNHNDGYTTQNKGEYYQYTGLDAVALGTTVGTSLTTLPSANVTADMLWTVEKVSGGYRLKNSAGYYLSASYDESGTVISVTENSESKDVASSGIGTLQLLATPDETCVWKISNSSGKVTLTNVSSKKILAYQNKDNVTGTRLSPVNDADVSFFTVRSSNSKGVYIYQETKTVQPMIESGSQYVMVSDDGLAMSTQDGVGYNDATSDYRYEGRKAVSVQTEDGKITSAVTKDMVWTVTESGNGYTIQNTDGRYLCSSYDSATVIQVYLADSPEVWKLEGSGYLKGSASGKYLAYQTGSGSASVFTLRSSTSDASIFSFYMLKDTATKTALYVAGSGGVVSTSREVLEFNGEQTFLGSTATAKNGYTFLGWYCGEELVCSDARYVPTAAGVYTARFKENVAAIKYQVKISGTGDPSVPELTVYEENLGVVTGSATGSTAKTTQGYTFLYWTNEDGKVVGSKSYYLPSTTDGLYTDATYYAVYEKEIVCYGVEVTELSDVQKGTHYLYVNGTDCGRFVFTEVDGGWSLYSVENKKFAAVNDSNEFYYSSVYDTWSYSNGSFSTSVPVKILFFTINRTYYLTVSDGTLAVSTTAPASTVLADKEDVGYTEHDIITYGEITEETHSGVCTRCGKAVTTQPHSYTYTDNGDGTHTGTCACGKTITAAHTGQCTSVDDEHHHILCNLCGAESEAEHEYVYTDDGETHSAICSACGHQIIGVSHAYIYTDHADGTHSGVCACGAEDNGACEYGTDDKCEKCGHYDTSRVFVNAVQVNVTSTTSRGYFTFRNWRLVYVAGTTTYTAAISATVTGPITVTGVEYSTDNAEFTTGTSYSSTEAITALWIRVTDSNGQQTLWYYNGTDTEQISL